MREQVLINGVARCLAVYLGTGGVVEKRHVEQAKRLLSANGGPLHGRIPPDPRLDSLIG
jgi:hypothetical protein